MHHRLVHFAIFSKYRDTYRIATRVSRYESYRGGTVSLRPYIGIFQDKRKIAKVIPIFKKGDDTNLNNYRPIYLLRAISKIIEKAIYNQTYNYFDQNKILHAHQYGFRKQHSTELEVLELVDRTIH